MVEKQKHEKNPPFFFGFIDYFISDLNLVEVETFPDFRLLQSWLSNNRCFVQKFYPHPLQKLIFILLSFILHEQHFY